jgi:hypothetical protein
MGFVRYTSLVLIAIGLMLLGADIISTLEMKAIVLRSLDHVLALVQTSPKTWVDAHRPAWWAGVLGGMLAAPSWLLPAVFGGLLALISNRQKQPARPPPPPQD